MRLETVFIDNIDVPPRLRAVDGDKVRRLSSSIAEIGLQTPITVWAKPDAAFQLIAGAHRLEAARALGLEQIAAFFTDADEIDRQIWEIDENLMRSELTPTQEAEHLAKRKELWEARAVSAQVAPKPQGGRPKQFAFDTSEATGISKSTINRATARARDVSDEVRDAIRGTAMDKGTVLDKLRHVPKADQMRRLEEMRKGAVSQEEQTLQQFNRLMAAWNAANQDARREFFEAIDTPIMGDWK